MALFQLENISLEDFDCYDDREDSECGVHRGETKVDSSTGNIICQVCDAVVGQDQEEPDVGGGDDEEPTDDDDTDEGEGTTGPPEKDIVTEWDAEKKKLEAEKAALRNLGDVLERSPKNEARNFGILIKRDFLSILPVHKILNDATFYSARMYKKRMMLTSSFIYAIKELQYHLSKVVIEEAGEDIQKVRPDVLNGIRLLSGYDEGPIQTWMRIHGTSAGLPKELIEHAIDYFLEVEPRYVSGDDEVKAIAWLILTARTAGHPVTTKKFQEITGRSRGSIGRVVKAYAPYFEDSNV